jgi:hypothetical protein
MGLDMYLYAEQQAKEGSEKHAAIMATLTEEHRSNLDDRDYSNSAYISGWDFGPDYPMNKELAYDALIELTGMRPTSGSPHFNVVRIDDDTIAVEACCCYWRKANQIHRWFVLNTMDGVDDGTPSGPIHGEVLADLVDRCKQVLETPLLAAQLLPTQSGFFFGSVDYDEWYIADLKDTVEQLDTVFQTYPKPLVLRYRASW